MDPVTVSGLGILFTQTPRCPSADARPHLRGTGLSYRARWQSCPLAAPAVLFGTPSSDGRLRQPHPTHTPGPAVQLPRWAPDPPPGAAHLQRRDGEGSAAQHARLRRLGTRPDSWSCRRQLLIPHCRPAPLALVCPIRPTPFRLLFPMTHYSRFFPGGSGLEVILRYCRSMALPSMFFSPKFFIFFFPCLSLGGFIYFHVFDHQR